MKVKIVPGTNERLLQEVRGKVRDYLKDIVGDFVEMDGIFSFTYGSVTVNVEVVPWHSEDVLVKVFSYIAENVSLSEELMATLLEMNARLPLGAFALGMDNSVVFRYALAGANLNFNELLAAVYTVATVADSYDEFVKGYSAGMERRLD